MPGVLPPEAPAVSSATPQTAPTTAPTPAPTQRLTVRAVLGAIPSIVWGYVGVIVALVAGYFIIPGVQPAVTEVYQLLTSDDRTAIEAWVSGFGWWGPLLIVGLMIVQTILSAIPMVLVLIVAVLAYGPVYGGLLGWVGAILAALVGYWVGRTFGDSLQERFVTPKIRQIIEENVGRYGAWAILALRISPLVPSDGVSFMAGLLRMKFWAFLGGSVGGITPVVMAVAYFGSDFDRLRTGVIAVTVISLLGLLGFVVWDKFIRPKSVKPQ
jgi:uncharacterized membrane protein YdjX (TVP38/TMEM64 family)